MLKKIFLIFCAVLISCTGLYYTYAKEKNIDTCRDFLASYNWEVDITPTDKAEVTIPAVFDKVYENYNNIQKKAGLALSSYRGKSGTRYTFAVKNYPYPVNETVYANVILIDGKAVAGDIMTVSLSGFMHALSENHP